MSTFLQRTPGSLIYPRILQLQQPAAHHRSVSSKVPRPRYTLGEATLKLQERGRKEFPKAMYGVNITLNLDYRVKSNRMRGAFELPHSVGKAMPTAAMTFHDELKVEALLRGAEMAGDLQEFVRNHKDILAPIQRVVATDDMEPEFTRTSRFRSLLKRAKLLPDAETKTLVTADEFGEAVYKHSHGMLRPYETDQNGNIAVAIGQMRMDEYKLVENMNEVLEQLFLHRPKCFGTGPNRKKKNVGVFVLGMHITSTMNLSLPLDLESFPILEEKNRPPRPEGEAVRISEADIRLLQHTL